MDDAQKAKELLLISSKEDEIVYNIKSAISDLTFKENSKITKVEIKNAIRKIMARHERLGDVKNFIITTTGDLQFNVAMYVDDKEYSLTLSLKTDEK